MKKIIAGSMIYLLALSTQAIDFRSIVDDVVEDATRKSSCTYRLWIEGVAKDRVEPIKRTGTSRNNACANAKIACAKKGEKEGFFGRHTCTKLDSDNGGIVRQVINGTNGRNVSRSSRSELVKHIEQLEVELAAKSKTISRLNNEVRVLALEIENGQNRNVDLEMKELRRANRNLKSIVSDEKEKNRNLTAKYQELQKAYDNYANAGKEPQDVVSLMKECDSATDKTSSMHKCVKKVKNSKNITHSHIRACDRATSWDSSFLECLNVVEEFEVELPYVKACDDATDKTNSAFSCMKKVKGYAPNLGIELIVQCDYSTSFDAEFSTCLDLYL